MKTTRAQNFLAAALIGALAFASPAARAAEATKPNIVFVLMDNLGYGEVGCYGGGIRWPGKIPAGRVSNEIVHELDTFTTFAKFAGAPVPSDRPIDGVDQTDFLLGKREISNREGLLLFCADRLEATKWRNWKLAFYDEQRDWFTPPAKLGTPKLFNLILDPKEEYQVTVQNTWAIEPMTRMIAKFYSGLPKASLIAPGTPDPYVPPTK